MRAQTMKGIERREFIKRALVLAALPALPVGLLAHCSKANSTAAVGAQQPEWAGAADAPAQLSWRTTITRADEPGEPLVMSGTIYEADGVTPARGVLLYVYHTDAAGLYIKPGQPRLPPRLRGWMRTGADGRYEFRTIKPASYPGTDNPAHIHPTLSRADYPEYWFDSYWFAGDPFITKKKLATLSGRGGYDPVVKLTRGKDGVWYGRRNIRLERVKS